MPHPLHLAITVESGPVRFAEAPPAWLAVLVVLGIGLYVWSVYRREQTPVKPGFRLFLAGLRTIALLLPLVAFCRPYREETRKTEERSHLVLLLDTSASMGTVDRYSAEAESRLLEAAWPAGGGERAPARLEASRLELVTRLLRPDVLARLDERFVLHAFAFDESVRSLGAREPSLASTEGPETAAGAAPGAASETAAASIASAMREVRAAGARTDVGSALRTVWREFVGRDDRRLAGVVLLSDGRDNSESRRPTEAVASLGRSAEDLRLTAVALGDPRLARNLKVDAVSAKDDVLIGDDVAFQVVLRHKGFANVDGVEVRLEIDQVVDRDGKTLPEPRRYDPNAQGGEPPRTSVRVRLGAEGEPTPLALRAPFAEAGTYEIRVRAILPGDLAREDAIREDDVKVHRLRVKDQTIRVLLCDGILRHETWFLKNLLVREARQRGDPRRMDAQVFIQSFDPDLEQPHGSALPALRTFPSTRQEIFSYDVVILGEVEWRRLAATEHESRRILTLLREFVAEGGGIAFVAGVDHDPLRFLETPLQDLLPVVVQPKDAASEGPATVPFRIAPTEAGLSHPILSVVPDATPQAIDSIWRERAGWEWYWLYRAKGGLKTGAVALARVFGVADPSFRDERQEPLVVFATMNFGKGRVFFSAVDQIYRIRREHGDAYYGTLWHEAVRWLATYRLLGGNKRFKIQTDREDYFVGDFAMITVSALDADYQPLASPTLSGLQVEDPEGRPLLPVDFAARPDTEAGPGVYAAQVRLPRSGAYRIYVDPPSGGTAAGGTDPTGGAAGRAEKRIAAAFATKEDQDTIPDHETLKSLLRLANPPGQPGALVAPWDLASLVESLPSNATERLLDSKKIPLWDREWTILLAVALLGLEWWLRKRAMMV